MPIGPPVAAGEAMAQATEPAVPAVEGPSCSRSLKLLTTGIVLAAAYGLWSFPQIQGRDLPDPVRGLFAGALLVLFVGWWNTLTGRTSIDERAIRQTGLWNREVPLQDIRRCRLVHLRRLEWLIAPRLIVHSGMFGVKTFYAADPGVLQAFRRLIRLQSG